MSLESKAKTSMQIIVLAAFIQKDEMGITMMDEEMLNGITPNTKWVKLEDAQNREAQYRQACAGSLEAEIANYKAIQKHYEAKIEAANKILQQAIEQAKHTPQPQDMKTRLTFEFGTFEQLCEALQIQSQENQKELQK